MTTDTRATEQASDLLEMYEQMAVIRATDVPSAGMSGSPSPS